MCLCQNWNSLESITGVEKKTKNILIRNNSYTSMLLYTCIVEHCKVNTMIVKLFYKVFISIDKL